MSPINAPLAMVGIIGMMVLLTLAIVGGTLAAQESLYAPAPGSSRLEPAPKAGSPAKGPVLLPSIKTATVAPALVQTAQCNGAKNPNCTRHDIWNKCFMPLVDRHPKDGFMTEHEVQRFMDDFLRTYERWLAPAASKIANGCDHPMAGHRPNGRVNWPIFETATDPICLGTETYICYAKDVCDRELRRIGLPTTTVIYE